MDIEQVIYGVAEWILNALRDCLLSFSIEVFGSWYYSNLNIFIIVLTIIVQIVGFLLHLWKDLVVYIKWCIFYLYAYVY